MLLGRGLHCVRQSSRTLQGGKGWDLLRAVCGRRHGSSSALESDKASAPVKKAKLRLDYVPPEFTIPSVFLEFRLGSPTTVSTRLTVQRAATDVAGGDANVEAAMSSLWLDGKDLELKEGSLKMDGHVIPSSGYVWSTKGLKILDIPTSKSTFELSFENRLWPERNTSLEGLYLANKGTVFCTQCEAESFSNITFFMDRPDVLSRFTTTIIADKEKYPALLSNGNEINYFTEEVTENGSSSILHGRVFSDPFPKPCYLFALVAGDLDVLESTFNTKSGNTVALNIYAVSEDIGQCDHAMKSLQKSMKWDEDVYGLEYDLDMYNVVAVRDFNAGAMENKGLNIFNTKYVLSGSKTATDMDFNSVESVIAHEYFHNWTGNRVTLRDWFQLSLKEGLTVFRDQEFSSDMNSRAVQRIKDVRIIRTAQFKEDSSPLAHPVRPDEYIEINNFYTTTVYQKGAEVIRMLETILGRNQFNTAVRHYIKKFDGTAATCDDFVDSLEESSGVDLSKFRDSWYCQAGTPRVAFSRSYDASNNSLSLHFEQKPGMNIKTGKPYKPFCIPIRIGVVDPSSKGDCSFSSESALYSDRTSSVFLLEDQKQSFTLNNVASPNAIPSIFRSFSAPVMVEDVDKNGQSCYSVEELAHLMAYDSDSFGRWEASQKLAKEMFSLAISGESDEVVISCYIEALRNILQTCGARDLEMDAELLTMPSTQYLMKGHVASPYRSEKIRQMLSFNVAKELRDDLLNVYNKCTELSRNSDNSIVSCEDFENGKGSRALANATLRALCQLDSCSRERVDMMGVERESSSVQDTLSDSTGRLLAMDQFRHTQLMTNRIGALSALCRIDCDERDDAFSTFFEQYRNNDLVFNKYISLVAMSPLERTIDDLKNIIKLEEYEAHRNPNRCYSLIGGFCANMNGFHTPGGKGYEFVANQIITIDKINPAVAGRLVTTLAPLGEYDRETVDLLLEQLYRIKNTSTMSKNVSEVVESYIAFGKK
eukprot:Nk52_evm35s2657 gene=Nk52_evmTU35s2657